jgi:hypothetical protein
MPSVLARRGFCLGLGPSRLKELVPLKVAVLLQFQTGALPGLSLSGS